MVCSVFFGDVSTSVLFNNNEIWLDVLRTGDLVHCHVMLASQQDMREV